MAVLEKRIWLLMQFVPPGTLAVPEQRPVERHIWYVLEEAQRTFVVTAAGAGEGEGVLEVVEEAKRMEEEEDVELDEGVLELELEVAEDEAEEMTLIEADDEADETMLIEAEVEVDEAVVEVLVAGGGACCPPCSPRAMTL